MISRFDVATPSRWPGTSHARLSTKLGSALPDSDGTVVITAGPPTGGSLLKAIERATEAGLEVVQCITVVDREEGAATILEAAGYKLEALATRTQLEAAG